MPGYNLGMTQNTISFKPEELIGKLNELEKVLLPRAVNSALHRSVFLATQVLKDEAKSKFRNPVPWTLKSFRYERPTPVPDGMEARVYISDDASKGNPPAQYLQGVMGGSPNPYLTRFQRMLRRLPDRSKNPNQDILGNQGSILPPGEIMVPTRSPKVKRNKWGNMSSGQYTQILTDLAGGTSSADWLTFNYEKGRMKRKGINERRKARGLKPRKYDRYFYMNDETAYKKNLNAPVGGIFLKTKTGRVHRIMTQAGMSGAPFKFDFEDISKNSIRGTLREELTKKLKF